MLVGEPTIVRVKMGTREKVIHMNKIFPLLLEDTSPIDTHMGTSSIHTHILSYVNYAEVVNDSSNPVDNNLLERTTQSGYIVRPIDY